MEDRRQTMEDDVYIENQLGVDFVVYSLKMMEQCMEYAGHHHLYVDIFYFPKMTLGVEYN